MGGSGEDGEQVSPGTLSESDDSVCDYSGSEAASSVSDDRPMSNAPSEADNDDVPDDLQGPTARNFFVDHDGLPDEASLVSFFRQEGEAPATGYSDEDVDGAREFIAA